ncbi:unnamed protein product [Closterium sp. NIES-64]|nr:unnamed protein product [Closterium sp. NIES-64]
MEEDDAAVAVRVLKERLTWQPSAVTSRGERGENGERGERGESGESAESDSSRRVREVILTAENESNRERLHGMLRDVACDGLCLSLLLLGPRGCGKTLVLQRALADLRASPHTPPFLAVHLDGRMHADDRAALKEMARQLSASLPHLDSLSLHSYSDNVWMLHHVLRCPSAFQVPVCPFSQKIAHCGARRIRPLRLATRSLIVVLDEFDHFASVSIPNRCTSLLLSSSLPLPTTVGQAGSTPHIRGKQGILYLLLDFMHSLPCVPTQRPPSVSPAPPNPDSSAPPLHHNTTAPATNAPPNATDSWAAFAAGFNERVEAVFQHPSVLAVLLQSTAVNRTAPHIFKLGFRAVCEMVRRGGQTLSVADFERAYAATTQPIRQQMLSEYESRRVAARGSVSDVFSQESALQAYGRLIDANFVAVVSGQQPASVEDLEFLPARLLVTAYELEEAINKNPRVPLELRNWLQQGLHEGAPVM